MKRVTLALGISLLLSSNLAVAQTASIPPPEAIAQQISAGQLVSAHYELQEILAVNPNNAVAYYLLAIDELKFGDRNKARADLVRAELTDPSMSMATPTALQQLRKAVGMTAITPRVVVSPTPLFKQPPWEQVLIKLGTWLCSTAAALVLFFCVWAGRRMWHRWRHPDDSAAGQF